MPTNFKTSEQKAEEAKEVKEWRERYWTDPEFRRAEQIKDPLAQCNCMEYGVDGTKKHSKLEHKFKSTLVSTFLIAVCANHYLNYKQNPEFWTELENPNAN